MTGRNQPCSCGSGLKFKRCCGDNVKLKKQRDDEMAAYIARLRERALQREREATDYVKLHGVRKARMSPFLAAAMIASLHR